MDLIFDSALLMQKRRQAFLRHRDNAAFLMDLVADELTERLSVVERHFETVAEINGIDGRVAEKALLTGKLGHLIRVDTDPVFARPDDEFLTSPLEILPLKAQSVNLILSPLSLHVINDLPGMLVQMRQALKKDGLVLAALPGAGTLKELRDVLLSVESEMTGGASPRIYPFADVRDMGSLLQRAGFALPVVDVEDYTVRYNSLFDLVRDLRAMGMTSALTQRSRKPLNRAFLMKAAERYSEKYADADGRIRATFSIIFASGWVPDETQRKPLKPGSATIRLADALKASEDAASQADSGGESCGNIAE